MRYLPAAGSLNVCGDWYDVVDLPGDRFAVAVGDVVGHGLEAASVMGMLRSALSAAMRTDHGPAQALEILGQYARCVEGALATSAVSMLITRERREITYSSAGHPPPVLLRADGSVVLLDQATDPPLGARPAHVARPQASVGYAPGDALVLYTDGLIERRGEDIDTGLARRTRPSHRGGPARRGTPRRHRPRPPRPQPRRHRRHRPDHRPPVTAVTAGAQPGARGARHPARCPPTFPSE